jgi:hypothetical protein
MRIALGEQNVPPFSLAVLFLVERKVVETDVQVPNALCDKWIAAFFCLCWP